VRGALAEQRLRHLPVGPRGHVRQGDRYRAARGLAFVAEPQHVEGKVPPLGGGEGVEGRHGGARHAEGEGVVGAEGGEGRAPRGPEGAWAAGRARALSRYRRRRPGRGTRRTSARRGRGLRPATGGGSAWGAGGRARPPRGVTRGTRSTPR